MAGTSMSPAVQKAFAYVHENFEHGRWQPGELLPSSRVLARTVGVSPATMIKAIAVLKAKGLVTGLERGRLRIAGGGDALTGAISPRDAAWRLKRSEIEKDLLSGVLAAGGRLPSLKELQSRYGACFRTIRKILHSMVSDGVLRMQGKSYQPAGAMHRNADKRIVFITPILQHRPDSALSQYQYRVLELLERESLARGILLEIVEIDFQDFGAVSRTTETISATAGVMGYVLDVWWLDAGNHRRSCEHILARLAPRERPIVVLDEHGEFILPIHHASNRMIQVYRLQTGAAADRMARRMLDMGHRAAAYISPMHIFPWSRRRLEGIQDQFTKAGLGNGVKPVVTDTMEIRLLHVLATADFDDDLVRQILRTNRTEHQAQDQYAALIRFKRDAPQNPFSRKETDSLKRNLAAAAGIARENVDPDFLGRMTAAALDAAGDRISEMVLAPLFSKALGDRSVTVWMCANDDVALAAMRFLAGKEVKVPADISVVGFDNKPVEALVSRLTTFDFNTTGFVYATLNFIARPPRPRAGYRHSPIEIEGVLLERGTTAPPRSLVPTP